MQFQRMFINNKDLMIYQQSHMDKQILKSKLTYSKLKIITKMKKINIDLFKISILAILIGFLYLFKQYSQNERYCFSNTAYDGVRIIIDTRTGAVWTIHKYQPAELISEPLSK